MAKISKNTPLPKRRAPRYLKSSRTTIPFPYKIPGFDYQPMEIIIDSSVVSPEGFSKIKRTFRDIYEGRVMAIWEGYVRFDTTTDE